MKNSGLKTEELVTLSSCGRPKQLAPVWEYVPFQLGKLKAINMKRPIESIHIVRESNSYCAVGAAGNRHWTGPQKTQADLMQFIHELRQTP